MKWSVKKLGELGTVSTGATPRTSEPEYYDGDVPFVTPAELDTILPVTTTPRTLTDKGAAQARVLPEGAVMVCCIGSLGKIGIAGRSVATNQQINSVVFDRKQILPRYGFYACRLLRPKLECMAPATTLPIVSKSKFAELTIPVPPLVEQRRIAEVLDRAEALRAKRRAALAQLDSLTQSIFLDLFGDPVTNPKGWPRMRLEELLKNIDSGWSPKCLDRPVTNGEWGILKLGAVTWCEYDPSENKALPSGINPDPTIEVRVGDLLFVRKNTYELVAACALVRETPPRLLMSDLIFRLQLHSKAPVDSTFLQQLLVYPAKRRDIQKLAGGSAGSMPNISKGRLRTIDIELPPIALQREFARRVAAVEKLKAAQRASLAEMDALFASLQHRAFQGQL